LKKTVQIPYGTGFVEIELPEERIITIVSPKKVKGLRDVEAEIRKALENPIGHPGIKDLAKKGKSE